MRRAVVVAVGLVLGCAWWPWRDTGVPGDEEFGVEVVDYVGITEFHATALGFYELLAHRRINTYATYKSPALREYFRSEEAFADYYADLAGDLADAHFEQNVALEVQVAEFLFDGPGRARVRLHLVGEDGYPLRPGTTDFEREDRWERREGRWWIVPEKL